MRLAEFVQFRAPAGFSETIHELAEREGVSASELMRRAILADIEERRDEGGPDAVDDSPQPRQRSS